MNAMQLYISCKKSDGLHLVELGLMAGRLAVRLRFEVFKACCRSISDLLSQGAALFQQAKLNVFLSGKHYCKVDYKV